MDIQKIKEINKKYDKLNIEKLFCRCGDPFVDAGGYVLECLYEIDRYKDKDILYLIDDIIKIYVDRWQKGIYQFFLNSKMNQNANGWDDIKRKKEAFNYYKSIIEESCPERKHGICRVLGFETILYKSGRENVILAGATSCLNFHHGLEQGIYYSKEALVRSLFVPFACEVIGENACLAMSNQPDVIKHIIKESVFSNISKSNYYHLLKSRYSNAECRLFGYIEDIINGARISRDNKHTLSLTLLSFTNCAQNPYMSIYTLPSKIVSFYIICKTRYSEEWNKFLNSQYIKYNYHSTDYNVQDETYNENIKEALLFDKEKWDAYQEKENVDLRLSLYSIIKNNDGKDCYIVDKQEYDNNKKGADFKNKTSKEDKESIKKMFTKSKTPIIIRCKGDVYKHKWRNRIFEKLILGESLLSLFVKWTDPQGMNQSFDFEIVKLYLKTIKNMNEKTLELIERIASFIVTNNEDNLTKVITQIKKSKSYEFRSLLIKQMEKKYTNGEKDPLFTLREYVKYLIPEGSNINEIRDLILICIYQKLHEKVLQLELEDVDINNEDVDIND